MADLHEVVFRWPHSEASDVIVTGSFDQWTHSTHLTKTPSGFEGTALIPWGQSISYKYIVDGRWTTSDDQPIELDPIGNLNNVYSAPPRPAPAQEQTQPETQEPETTEQPAVPAESSTGSIAGMVDTVTDMASTAKETAVAMVEAIAPGTTSQAPATPSADPAPTATASAAPPPPPASEPTTDPPTPQSGEITPGVVLPPSETTAPRLAPRVPMHILPLQAPQPSGSPEPREAKADIDEDEVQASTHTPVGMGAKGVDGTAVNGNGNGNGNENGHVNGRVEIDGEQAVEAGDEAGRATPKPMSAPPTPAVIINGTDEVPISPAVNGVGVPPSAPSPQTNGTSPPTTPALNGTAPKALPATPTSASGTPPSTPPANGKDKRMMRFPSLSARSHRSRTSSSTNTSVTEFGSTAGGEKDEAGREAHAKRVGSERKKRTSIFGKLKGIFDSPGK